MLAGIGVIFYLMCAHTPLMMDDYDYSFSWATGEKLTSLSDIFASQIAHYSLWGGRSVTHFLVQLFLLMGNLAAQAARMSRNGHSAWAFPAIFGILSSNIMNSSAFSSQGYAIFMMVLFLALTIAVWILDWRWMKHEAP
jgi:hypothetical protein